MELLAKIKSLDEVKDQTVSLSELYVEKNGAFFLNAKEIDGYGLNNGEAMRTVMEDAKAQKKAALDELSTLKSSTDSLRLKISELEAGGDLKAKEKIEALKEEITKQYTEKLEASRKNMQTCTVSTGMQL